MSKKRILFIGEASFLNTGFSNIYRSLLPRLVKTNKYEIAELGSYADGNHAEIKNFINGRWKFYPGLPSTPEEQQEFNKLAQSSHPRDKGQNISQFSAWCFDKVLCDFKPDCVVAIRDNWMDTWVLRSPLRSFFKFLWMPTVDSPQQDENWVDDYEKCNLVMAYSDFGVHTLKSQSPKIKLFPKPMRPGVDLDIFKPSDKQAIREKFNLSNDNRILGFMSRNQSRKLILDTIDAFSLMKLKNKDNEAIRKSILLLHTSWPDNMHSFDYPRHIKRLQSSKWMRYHNPGIMYDILQTLICHNCGAASVAYAVNLFGKQVQQTQINGKKVAGILMPCSYCGQQTATCPNTGIGFTREQMAEMYNLLDVLVHCSIAEGCGMGIQEAKSCGVPCIVTDHSAVAEKGRFPAEYVHFKELNIDESKYTVHKGGIAHKVAGYRHEPETHCLRAIPDVDDFSNKMQELIINDELRAKMSVEARQCAEDNYDWDKTCKQWEFVLDSVKALDRKDTWDSPIEISDPVTTQHIPDGLDDEQYVQFLYLKILGYPQVDPNGAQMWLDHLKQGVKREQLMEQFVQIANSQSDSSRQRNIARQKYSTDKPVEKQQVQEWI
jgi:glycosyltransferase involved in cell wall biosynthesis